MQLSAQPITNFHYFWLINQTTRIRDTNRPVSNAPLREVDVLKYDNEINSKHNKSRLSNDVVEVVDLVVFSSLVKF